MQAALTLMATVIFNMIAHSLMKMSSIRDSLMPYFFLGIFFFGCSVFFYRASLKIFPLNKAFLILNGSSYVLIGIISVYLFDENFSVKLLLSYLLVIVGLFLSFL
jgi:multidrug transporter EmrE-like cation transporter